MKCAGKDSNRIDNIETGKRHASPSLFLTGNLEVNLSVRILDNGWRIMEGRNSTIKNALSRKVEFEIMLK